MPSILLEGLNATHSCVQALTIAGLVLLIHEVVVVDRRIFLLNCKLTRNLHVSCMKYLYSLYRSTTVASRADIPDSSRRKNLVSSRWPPLQQKQDPATPPSDHSGTSPTTQRLFNVTTSSSVVHRKNNDTNNVSPSVLNNCTRAVTLRTSISTPTTDMTDISTTANRSSTAEIDVISTSSPTKRSSVGKIVLGLNNNELQKIHPEVEPSSETADSRFKRSSVGKVTMNVGRLSRTNVVDEDKVEDRRQSSDVENIADLVSAKRQSEGSSAAFSSAPSNTGESEDSSRRSSMEKMEGISENLSSTSVDDSGSGVQITSVTEVSSEIVDNSGSIEVQPSSVLDINLQKSFDSDKLTDETIKDDGPLDQVETGVLKKSSEDTQPTDTVLRPLIQTTEDILIPEQLADTLQPEPEISTITAADDEIVESRSHQTEPPAAILTTGSRDSMLETSSRDDLNDIDDDDVINDALPLKRVVDDTQVYMISLL